jgi:hypothetical protein
MGAAVLLAVGGGTLLLGRGTRWRFWLALLALAPALYIGLRTVGDWDASQAVRIAEKFSVDRAASLEARLRSEDTVWVVMRGSLWGTGRFLLNRMATTDQEGRVVSDGMWLISLTRNGLVGLALWLGAMVHPGLCYVRYASARVGGRSIAEPAAVLAVVLSLYGLDCLMNAMINPIFCLISGGLVSLSLASAFPAPVHSAGLVKGRWSAAAGGPR